MPIKRKPNPSPSPYNNGSRVVGSHGEPNGDGTWKNVIDYADFGVPFPSDIYGGYKDLFSQWSKYDRNFWENLLDLNETDARDFAFTQLGKSQDYLATLEQRSYNEHMLEDERRYNYELLEDQRAYETPSSQLSRLMATGLSRGAALELLQGMQATAPASTPISAPSMPMSADGTGVSAASRIPAQQLMEGISTALNTVSGIMGLVSAGVNISNAQKQAQLLDNSVYASQLQTEGIRAVGSFISSIYSRDSNGKPFARPDFNDLSSADEWISWAQDDKRKVDNPAVFDFMRSPAARSMSRNPFAISLLDQQFVAHSNAQQERNTEEGYLRAQLLIAQKDLANVEWRQAMLDFDWNAFKFEDYNLTRPTINEYNKRKWANDLYILTQTSDPNTLKFLVNKIKDDAEFNAFVTAYQLQSEKNIDSSSEMKGAREMCYFLRSLGFGEGVVGQAILATGMFSGAAGNTINSILGSQDEDSSSIVDKVKSKFDPLGNFFKSVKRKLPKPQLPNFLDLFNNSAD